MAPEPFRPGPLWVDGQITLRLNGGRPRCIGRPFALIGRTEGSDVRLSDREVSARHAYLHLDHRGLFALDLASRIGMRIDGAPIPDGWLNIGQTIEIADERIEVVDLQIAAGSPPLRRPATTAVALTDITESPLVRVGLYPASSPKQPWLLNSELVVMGRSPACGVPIQGTTAARVHAVIVRTLDAAYIVDLNGWGFRINGHLVRNASVLIDGDILAIGSSQFEVRLAPNEELGPTAMPAIAAKSTPALLTPVEILPQPPADLVPAEAQTAVLAWMMGAVQAIQTELVRRQDASQRDLMRAVCELHKRHEDALASHQTQVEEIQRELSVLREEIHQFLSQTKPPTPALPPAEPLRIAPATPSADPEAAAAWLLDRVQRLGNANRASWLDLLGRSNSQPDS